jgi:hypothetical protein
VPDAFSIKIFLADGTPDGLRIVEKSNWTGVGLVCTRSQYPNVRNRREFQGAGAYVLVGPGKNLLPRVYVGEAEVLRKRLDNHHQNNEFWTRFVAFTSRDGNLNKAHVRYLEARLIALAKAVMEPVVLWMLLVAGGRRRRRPVIVAGRRRATRVCDTRLIRRVLRRSCWSCARPGIARMACGCAG